MESPVSTLNMEQHRDSVTALEGKERLAGAPSLLSTSLLPSNLTPLSARVRLF